MSNPGRRLLAGLAALAVCATTLAACGSSGASGGNAKAIRIGYFPDISPVALMKNDHMLEKLGYRPTYTEFLKGIPQEAAAMIGGSVDVVWSNAAAATAIFSNDPGAAYLVGQIVTDDNQIVARRGSGITSVAQLEGKRIATTGLTTGPQLVLDLAMRRAGKDPSSVDNVQEPGPLQATILEQKAADAATTFVPFGAEMALAGNRILTTADEALGHPFPAGAFVASKSFADAHPDAVTAVLQAARQAADQLRRQTPSDIQALAEFTAASPQAIRYSFDHHLVSFTDSQVPDMAALTAVAQAEKQYGFVTNGGDMKSFLKGFVNSTFARRAAQ